MDFGVINTALQNVAKLVNEIKDNATSLYMTKSLSEVTKLTRVEPLTILSKDCLNLEYMQDINMSLLNMFSAYYLQAVAMLTKVSDVEVVRILDSLNPDRDETGFLLAEKSTRGSLEMLVEKNYQYALPRLGRPALEFEKENEERIVTVSNLSVGKLLNVEIQYSHKADKASEAEERTVHIPVDVRLMVSSVPDATIAHLLSFKTEDNSVTERFHAWRAGRISFIRDMIFCQDLIDEYKKAMIGDDTGTMQEIIRRVNNAKKFGLLTKNPSLVSASNIFVVTENSAREIENRLGGKLSNPRIRQKAFENTYAMIIVVVDREWERVTFYTRGINASTNLSIKEIKSASKNKGGADIMDLMRAMQMGQSPSF